MKIFVDLRDKGHPDYFMANPDTIEDLSCSCDTLQLNEKVSLLNLLSLICIIVHAFVHNTEIEGSTKIE